VWFIKDTITRKIKKTQDFIDEKSVNYFFSVKLKALKEKFNLRNFRHYLKLSFTN